MNTKKIILSLTISLLLSACVQDKALENSELKQDKQLNSLASKNQAASHVKVVSGTDIKALKLENPKNEVLSMKGTIMYQKMEGGFYSFITDDGKKFTPRGLGKEHRKHGLIVSIQGVILTDVMTTTQFGDVLDVKSIKVLNDTKVQPPKSDL